MQAQRRSWSRSSPRRRSSSASTRSRSAASTRPKARRSTARRGRTASARHITSAFVKEALDRGAELFDWDERKARAGKRDGSEGARRRRRGRPARRRLDRLRRPDDDSARRQAVRAVGRRQPRHAFRASTSRASRPTCWRCRGTRSRSNWGDTAKNLPWTCMSVGSQTTHAMTRANHGRRDGRASEAAGDRRERSRRHARTTTRSATSASSARAIRRAG